MQELVHTQGLILRTEPIGEYDRRLVILTKDRGKISAFARGARRQNNRLIGCSDYFCFGEFKLYPGRNSYSLSEVTVQNAFQELRDDFTAALYGMYFLEVMEYHTRENNDEKEMLKLLYQALRALTVPTFHKELVKAVFELKVMGLMGEYEQVKAGPYLPGAIYAQDFILSTRPEGLFKFTLTKEVQDSLKELVAKAKKRLWNGHAFKSEEMISMLEL